MPKDRSERRTYRKSPGRQYGYDYDPLQSQSGKTQSGLADSPTQTDRWHSRTNSGTKSGTLLAQRPDLRRTRQLLRQNILANKARPNDEMTEESGEAEGSLYQVPTLPAEMADQYGYPIHNGLAQPHIPSTTDLMEAGEAESRDEQWGDFNPVDPDLGYEEEEDPLDIRMGYAAAQPVSPRTTRQIAPARSVRPASPEDLDEYADELEDDDEPKSPRRRRRNVSRRGLIVGLGLVAVGGTGLAAYELGPKVVPQAIGDAGANIQHQIDEAFKNGLAQGAEKAQKEMVAALENLEGFTLDGAITTAKLTRVAYDTFVSPIIQAGASVTGEVLSGMLSAFKTARSWLRGASLDNATLAAIEKVLQSWVDQSASMPKQITAITQADLEGAQAYLQALKRKIDTDKAALNKPKASTTPVAKPTAQATPKK